MINFYRFKLCKNYKNKLVFYSKKNNEKSEILNDLKSYKNCQKIKFNQKQTFTIKKRFTLDWHTRPHFNGQISKNQKFLKLASFYSQLNSTNFSKKFASLMILRLTTKIKHIKDIKQPNYKLVNSNRSEKIRFEDKQKELENNQNIFSNLKYKDNIWFSKIFMPFSNRNYWWILLPTQSILTRMRWNIYLKQITNIFSISHTSISSKEVFNSKLVFDFFPEFLIEKPIYWYWMLPFFGCIALISNNLNLSFFKENNSIYTLQKKVDLNIYSNFYQHEIQNSISWEMFQFFDYKKILFDSSFICSKRVSLNNETLLLQIKKSWLSRQKEHYICNYQDNLIQTKLTNNWNQLTKIKTIHWWERNWQKSFYKQSGLNSSEFENSIHNNFLLDNYTFNINKKTIFYSFDSLFYSNFFWYWHTLDTRNISDFINLNYSNLIYKKYLQENKNFSLQKVFKNWIYPLSNHSIYSLNDCFTINEFPLKIKFPWLLNELKNNKLNQKIKYQPIQNLDYLIKKEKRNDYFSDTHTIVSITSKKNNNNNYPLIGFQIKKINLKFKKIFDWNFLHKWNFLGIKDLVTNENSIQSKSSFLFCISSKKQSKIKQKELISPISLILNDTHTNISMFNNGKLLNKKGFFSNITLYNGIGCEIFESEFNPIYGWNSIEFNSKKKNVDQRQNNLELTNNLIKPYLKKNQSLSSFHQASFLLEYFLSKLYFESGLSYLTTKNLINYFYTILNLKNKNSNNYLNFFKTQFLMDSKKNIQIQKNPIVMSGFDFPHLNLIFHDKNPIIKNISNSYNCIDNQIRCILPPNIISNQLKFNNFLKSNQKQALKTTFHQVLNNKSNFSPIRQSICIIKKKVGKIDPKSKQFEHFVILNLLKNSKIHITFNDSNKKKIAYRKEFFTKKTISKYKTIRPSFNDPFNNEIVHLQNKILKIKHIYTNGSRNITNNNAHNSSLLIGYSDSIIKEKINNIFKEYVFLTESKRPFFSPRIFSNSNLFLIKKEQKNISNFFNYNNFPKYIYVSNKSIFWDYINSTYNSTGLLNTTQPFIFDKFNEFRKKIRMNGKSRKKTYYGSNDFSNLLLQKYQRKSKNWPSGADPQGFFYKRINKLNFKQIQKKQNIEENEKIINYHSNIFKKLKNFSGSKPVAELLWEVRTKHKIPEVLLIQQTLFFQKKFVRKSNEEKNLENKYSSIDQGLSQKVQTLLRKMTQRRCFRKHVFLETLFHWTRDAINLRKMLRKTYFKNHWPLFLKYVLKSKNRLVLSDYYSSWYKKNFSPNKNKYNLYISDSFNTNFKLNYNKIIKMENIRPFFYNFIQTKTNKKLFQSKSNINFVLKNFYKNVSIDLNLFKNPINNKFFYNLNFKNKKINNNLKSKKSKIFNFISFKERNYVSKNLLVFPEWKIFNFNNVALSNVFVETRFQKLLKKSDNITSFKKDDSLDPLSFILINHSNNNYFLSNQLNSYNFINQQNLSKISFPLYNISNPNLFKMANTNNTNNFININKKDKEPIKDHLSFPYIYNFNNSFNERLSQTKSQSKQLNYFFDSNLSNILNCHFNYKKIKDNNSNKFFVIKKNSPFFNLLQNKFFEKNEIKSKFNLYSKQLLIRNRLLYHKIYFTNIFWHSNDFVLNTNSTIFTENQIIKNVIKQNWVFQIRQISSQNVFDREFNLNLNNLLATLSTWQSKFEIKRDLILQIFYIYLDHAGAFLNYIIKNLLLNNIINQIQNWDLLKNSRLLTNSLFYYKNEKDFLTKPSWSFDLLNHIKIQYPHLYNQIQIKNQSNFTNIQILNTVIKTPEFQSKTQLLFSPNFKTQLQFIESFRKNYGQNLGFLNSSSMSSNIYTNSINFKFIDQSFINKLSSQSLIIRNSTLFCKKWIENRQLSNFYKIQFLKKQRKLKQILNILKFKNEEIQNFYIIAFYNNKKNFNRKKVISFKRRSGFLFTRSLMTKNFNSLSSFSKVTRASISVYLNKNSANISVRNILFFIQILLLHVCLIFCFIAVYQSAFHFCLKSFLSLLVILIHYFLNIKYRFKRLIKYVYQSTVQSLITNFHDYFYSFDSFHRKLFVFLNNLSTVIFSNKLSIWGKIYKSSIPSFTNVLFKNPFSNAKNLERIQFIKTKNFINLKPDLIYPYKINKVNNLESFFYDVERNQTLNKKELSVNLKFDFIPKINLLKIIHQKKENHRMSLLRNTNIIEKANFGNLQNEIFFISTQLKPEKSTSSYIPWEKETLNIVDLLKKVIKNRKIRETHTKASGINSSIFKLSFKLLKWNLGLILLIGESDIFAELEPYREMHWYFLKRLPIFLRSNTASEDPINMYDYQADEKLRKFKEQFKKSTEIFQKRQNIIERKTERNRKKENVETIERIEKHTSKGIDKMQKFELINKKYLTKNHFLKEKKQRNYDNLIVVIKPEKSLKEKSIKLLDVLYINKITYFLNNFYFFRKKRSRGQPFWKPLFSFLAYTLFVSRLAKLNRQFRDSVLIINYVWIPFGPLTAILSSFLWKNWILNFSTSLNNQNFFINQSKISTKNYKTRNFLNSSSSFNQLKFSDILEAQYNLTEKKNLKTVSSYCSPFNLTKFSSNKINKFESNQFSYEIQKIWENINSHNTTFSQLSPPLLNRIFLCNFVKFEKKYKRALLKWNNRYGYNHIDLLDTYNCIDSSNNINFNIYNNSINIINKYRSLYIKNQERSAQTRYIHYKTYDPKVRLYRFYTNFSKNLHDIGIIQDAKNVHPLFGSLLCEIYSGLLSSGTKTRTQLSFFSSTKNILLVGNTNSANFVLLVQAFAAETGLKLFMEDAKRLRRLGRRGINKSTKRLEKLFEIAQAHSPCIVFLEDIDVIGSKRRVIKINEEEEDDDMAIRSFFSRLIYRKQHNYKSLNQSFIHQNLFISNEETYRNMQKSIIPESPIPSNLIKYQLTRRKAFSNYFSSTSNSSYKSFLTKFHALKKVSNGNLSNDVSSSSTNTVIIWKILKSKLVTPKKTIKETPWKHIPVDSMRSIPLITYSIRVKVAKLTMLAIYTMNTQLRLVKDLIKLLEKIQYESYRGFIVFATTNKLAILDPSLRRPGRFDETVYLPSLTVNPNYQRFSAIHFLNVLSVDSKDFVNFSRTFNLLNSMNFAIDWNINSVYGNVFIQYNSEKIFYPTRTSLRDLINSTADNVYNQNIFIQNENNIYQNIIPFDIWNNIGLQSFSMYSKSALLLSLAYSKAGQLIIKLFFQGNNNQSNISKVNNSKKQYNQIAFNSENTQLTIWPNAHIFAEFKKLNISYTSRNKNIKNFLINYFAGKIGEFCFFAFYKNTQKDGILCQQNQINSDKKIKINHLFEKNAFGLRSLYSIQPNWKNINAIIFSLIRMSCLYSKNHLTSKLFYLDDIFKKRQRIFSENIGSSLLFEYFHLNTESFLKRNTIPLEEHLQKQQTQKYLLNLQQKPLRKFLFDSTSLKISKNTYYLNKIYNQNILVTNDAKIQKKSSQRLALFRILFNELGSLDSITLRPTAMNYYYDKKISSKQRFRKHTYKWWNWHLKKTLDSLEEFQYLDFFPYADKQYNPRRQRWMLTNGYSAYWLAQEKILYYQIYEQLIIECFQISYLKLDQHREMLDYLVQLLMTKQLLTEIQWIFFFKRFM